MTTTHSHRKHCTCATCKGDKALTLAKQAAIFYPKGQLTVGNSVKLAVPETEITLRRQAQRADNVWGNNISKHSGQPNC